MRRPGAAAAPSSPLEKGPRRDAEDAEDAEEAEEAEGCCGRGGKKDSVGGTSVLLRQLNLNRDLLKHK